MGASGGTTLPIDGAAICTNPAKIMAIASKSQPRLMAFSA